MESTTFAKKSAKRKWGVLEITWFYFQLQKVRFRGSIQAKYVFEHLYWCCSNTCLNGSQRGVQTFERLLGSRSNTLFEHCLNVKTTALINTLIKIAPPTLILARCRTSCAPAKTSACPPRATTLRFSTPPPPPPCHHVGSHDANIRM